MTRMWMVNPKILCRNHLLGEHNELHKLMGSIKRKRSITGLIQKNCIEPMSIMIRHYQLVEEMEERGYNHSSVLDFEYWYLKYLPDNESGYHIDREQALTDLLERCPECAKRHKGYDNQELV